MTFLRYRRQTLLEGGGMQPDVNGQWVHVKDLGVESWDLDVPDRLPWSRPSTEQEEVAERARTIPGYREMLMQDGAMAVDDE